MRFASSNSAPAPQLRMDRRNFPSSATARQQQIFEAFNYTTYQPNAMDVQTGKLWDRLDFLPGTQVGGHCQFFSNPQGKSYGQTNVHRPCQLDASEAFAVQRFLFVFSSSATPEDIYGIAESLAFRFWIGLKWYAHSPLIALQTTRAAIAPIRICTFCQSVYVQARQCPGCGASDFKLSDLGDEQTGLQFFFEPMHSLVIENQASFFVDFDGPTWEVHAPLSIWCYLEGLHARGVL